MCCPSEKRDAMFGYHYVKKTSTAPATLAINEEQAAVVRSIFEMFASGNYGLVTISRHLEERRQHGVRFAIVPVFSTEKLIGNPVSRRL
jgi:hypothetical protein